MITTGGYTLESALKVAEETGQLIGFGTAFLSNVSLSLSLIDINPHTHRGSCQTLQPDLPFRLQKNLTLNAPDPATFYAVLSPEGYTTYPFSEEFSSLKAAAVSEVAVTATA